MGDNIEAWDSIASHWDKTLGDGNDMYHECLLPTIRELADPQMGERALDLGTGSAVIAAMLASSGAKVTAVDGSRAMLEKAVIRARNARLDITAQEVNLLDPDSLDRFCQSSPKSGIPLARTTGMVMLTARRFSLITCSMTLKELPDLEPIAEAIPRLLAPHGR